MIRSEFQMVNSLFDSSTPENLPISFTYDGVSYKGIPNHFKTIISRKTISSSLHETSYVSTDEHGLEIKIEHLVYKDFPVVEWVAYITNHSSAPSKIISNFKVIDSEFYGSNATLIHSNGDNTTASSYDIFHSELTNKPLLLTPRDGTSCNDASPYMKLKFDEHCIKIAIGWPGKWSAIATGSTSGAHLSIGQDRMNMSLLSGETMRSPRVNFMLFQGSDDRGINLWRQWYFKYIIPLENGSVIPPKLILHNFEADGKPEFTGATEENQILALNQYTNRGMKPDILWIDAGWYKCDEYWPYTGTWEEDKERFPNGLKPIGERCEELGVQLLLWFEPERVQPGTQLDTEHPDWLLYVKDASNKNRLFNYANKEALDWMVNHIDGLIKEYKVHIYRQDFNFNPLPYWIENEAEDRIGAIENLHIQGYLYYWDELIRRNPGLWIDSCAGGGRRNDLETMRRSIPLHYTDVGYGHHPIKQAQHRFMFEWIPYFRAHTQSWDNDEGTYQPRANKAEDSYAYHVAMTPSVTAVIPYDDTDEAFEASIKMQQIWRRAAQFMLDSDYYPLTETRKSEEDYYAMQFHNPVHNNGFFQVVRNTRTAEDSFTPKLNHINPNRTYILEDQESRTVLTISGIELTNNFEVKIPKRSGQLWFYSSKS